MGTVEEDQRIPVWLDCDPGHDDTFAILLAAYHPAIRILGVSTVFGNASLEKTTNNALSILTAIHKADSIPVYIGSPHALTRPPLPAPTDIHGDSGLDGTSLLPKPKVSARISPPAIDAAYAALKACKPGTAWVVATGAFTNIAKLFMTYPDLIGHIRGLSLMGGALGGRFTDAVLGVVDGVPRAGNWTQYAEFNVLADPEAAAFIFGNKELAAKTTLIPLDVSHLVLTTSTVRDLLLYGREGVEKRHPMGGSPSPTTPTPSPEGARLQGKTPLRTMLVELLLFFAKTYAEVFSITEGPPLHDPLAVAAVLTGLSETHPHLKEHEIPFIEHDPSITEPGLAQPERYEVSVVTEGSYEDALLRGARTGQIVAKKLPPGTPGVRIPRRLDVALFWEVLEECVQRADEAVARAEEGGKAE